MNNSNRLVVAVRDGSCGRGGIHCPCCNTVANLPRRTSFSGVLRTRLNNFVARDLRNNPSD